MGASKPVLRHLEVALRETKGGKKMECASRLEHTWHCAGQHELSVLFV